VGIQHHGRITVLLDVLQRRLPHLVVRDRDTDKHIRVKHLAEVGGQDRIHEARLPLDAAVVPEIAQLGTVPLVGRRRNAGGVDVREGRQDLLDRTLVLPANV
jgi:hypothetical protein